jgi:hypothetical protein
LFKKKDNSHGSLKELGRNRSSRRASERSMDSVGEKSLYSSGSRASSLRGGSFVWLPETETLQTLDTDFSPNDKSLSFSSDAISETELETELESNEAIDIVLPTQSPTIKSYVNNLALRNSGKRRASVAVWADEKLSQMAQSITARENKPSALMRDPSSLLSSEATDNDTGSAFLDEISPTYEDSQANIFMSLTRSLFSRCLSFLDLRTLLRLRRLNKEIYQLLLDDSFGLLSKVDLFPWHKQVDDEFLNRVLSYCGFAIRTLHLRNCWQITDQGIAMISTHAPRIENLVLASVWDITDGGITSLCSGINFLKTIDLVSVVEMICIFLPYFFLVEL